MTVLHGSRRTYAGFLALTAPLAFVGVLMVEEGRRLGWFVAVFFGSCVALFTVELVRPPRLEIDSDTFRVVGVGRSATYLFDRCGPFSVWEIQPGGHRLVVFDYRGDGPASHGRAARIARSLSGSNAALPDTYGLPAEGLARLLNERRVGGTHNA